MVEEFVYDSWGRPVGSRTGTGPWTCRSFDARGRPTSLIVAAFGTQAARTVSSNYAVGANPLVTSVADVAGTLTTTVDLLGRVVAYSDALGQTTTSTYDQAGRLTTTAGPPGTLATGFDAAGRPVSLRRNGAVVATATYSATGGELTGVALPSGAGNAGNATSGTVGYDSAGRTNALTWKRPDGSTLASDAVAYSQSGRVVTETVDGVGGQARRGTSWSARFAGGASTTC